MHEGLIMKYSLLWNTVRHLRGRQFLFQLLYRLHKPKFKSCRLSSSAYEAAQRHHLHTPPIPKWRSYESEHFTFLNLKHEFAGWNFTGNGMLWAYNQNYFDFINQKEVDIGTACEWIDKFVEELSQKRIGLGLDPYPIALRTINWINFFCLHPEALTKKRADSLYSQYLLLAQKLEYHLLGNHLLEDAFSLTIGAYYFCDERMKRKGTRLLTHELKEQILPDGAHYEQSPMYHCILLDRLLDTYNYTRLPELVPFAQRMLGHLESICYKDGTWPFFGDAALGIAPTPKDIKDYARRLGINWQALPLKECGYRKMISERMEAFVDIGNIMATYQPGHSHADSLTFELHIDGKPFIVDTGISTYDKNERRQYERSTAAHNTVTSQYQNSSEVWGGFRVGKRCKVKCTKDEVQCIEAEHDGFGSVHRRKFTINDNQFLISDFCEAERCMAHLHFAPTTGEIYIDDNTIRTPLANIKITGNVTSIVLVDCEVSTEYNIKRKSKEVQISFTGECTALIKANNNKPKA